MNKLKLILKSIREVVEAYDDTAVKWYDFSKPTHPQNPDCPSCGSGEIKYVLSFSPHRIHVNCESCSWDAEVDEDRADNVGVVGWVTVSKNRRMNLEDVMKEVQK